MRHWVAIWFAVLVLALLSCWQFRRLRQLEANQLQLAEQNRRLANAVLTLTKVEIMLVEKNVYLIRMYESVQQMRSEIEKREEAIEETVESWPTIPNEFEYQP